MIKYIAFRADPANDTMTDGMWCGQNGVNIEALKAWKNANPSVMAALLEKRRSRYTEHLSEVDQALIEKAKEGDTRAAELLYRRFENWTPKQAEAELKRNPTNKTFAELIAEEDV